jgi:hypothetical protein
MRLARDGQFVPGPFDGGFLGGEFEVVFRVPPARGLKLVFGLPGIQSGGELGPAREQGYHPSLDLHETAINEVLALSASRCDQQLSRPEPTDKWSPTRKNSNLTVIERKAQRQDRLIEERRFGRHEDEAQVFRNSHRQIL